MKKAYSHDGEPPAADLLNRTRIFWNTHPCDGHGDYVSRAAYRYAKEPWLLDKLRLMAHVHPHIVEIGCGQGTDGITLCSWLPQGGIYVGTDLSERSLQSAHQSARQQSPELPVFPRFLQTNAEELCFRSGTIRCVYSMGVLHHTASIQSALKEIHRVLAADGRAYVILYRTFGLKVLIAHAFRLLQASVDALLGTENVMYRLIRRVSKNGDSSLGTSLLEGFGVPKLTSFTRRRLQAILRDFELVSLEAYGPSLPLPKCLGSRKTKGALENRILGCFWFVELAKGR